MNTYKNNFNNIILVLWKLRQEDCFKFDVYIASSRPVWATDRNFILGEGDQEEKERQKRETEADWGCGFLIKELLQYVKEY